MKNKLCVYAFALLLCFTILSTVTVVYTIKSVHKEIVVKPAPARTCYDFSMQLIADYAKVKQQYGDSVKFYEAQGHLSETIDSIDRAKVIWMMSAYALNDSTIIVEHPTGAYDSEPTVTIIRDEWQGDKATSPDVRLCLDIAIDRLIESDVKKPKSSVFALHLPESCSSEYPSYYFGTSRTGFVKVNSYTGQVEHSDFGM